MKGTLSISRTHCNNRDDYISIRLTDELSSVAEIRIEMGFEELALALTGQGHIPCSFETHCLDLIGKKRLYQERIIPRPGKHSKKVVTEALDVFRADGWKIREENLTNSHRWVGKDELRVEMEKFVDVEEEGE